MIISIYILTPRFFSKKVLVPGSINNAFLDNLIPDTPYSVTVTALYADGEGSPVKDNGKTRKHNDNVTFRWCVESHDLLAIVYICRMQ